MIARLPALAMASALVCSFVAAPAMADGFGVSFQYSSHSPRYYTTTSTTYRPACAPSAYVYYDDDGCYDPAVLVRHSTPRAAVYDSCYPTTYRTTYTRSRCYTPPVRHVRTATHHRSGHRTQHYGHSRVYRRRCSTPRPRITVHRRGVASHGRQHISRDRHRSSRDSHRSLFDRIRDSRYRQSGSSDRCRSSHYRGGNSSDRHRDSRHHRSRSPRARFYRR